MRVVSFQGPSSKVRTTSPGCRKSCSLNFSAPKPGPPVVSISTVRDTPSALGLPGQAAGVAVAGSAWADGLGSAGCAWAGAGGAATTAATVISGAAVAREASTASATSALVVNKSIYSAPISRSGGGHPQNPPPPGGV